MNKFILGFLFFFSLQTSMAASNPDILVYTRTETKWNIFLLKEFRTFMNNLNLNVDPYSFSLDTPIVYSEENVEKYVTGSADELLNKVSKALNLKFAQVSPKLSVIDFGYEINQVEPKINPIENEEGNVILEADIDLKNVNVFASEIALEFSIKGLKKKPTVRIINPRVILQPGFKLNFGLDVILQERKDAIQIGLRNGDFSRITEMLNENPDMIDIDYDEIIIPEVKMGFAGRDLEVNNERIVDIIAEAKPSLKVILFEQLHELFKKDGATEILKKFDNILFDKNHWLVTNSESMFPMFLGMKDFSVPFKGVVLTELEGNFCTTNNYNENKSNCINKRVTKLHKSLTTTNDTESSKKLIQKRLEGDQNVKFLASVSEDYLNKVLATTIDFGIWKPIESEMGIELGEKGVVARLDESGNYATIILDVKYDAGKTLGLVLRERYLNFPVVLKATMRSEYINVDGKDLSHIVFNIFDIVLDDEILINGHQKYGFPSNIKDVRRILRKKTLKTIKKELFEFSAPNDPANFSKWKGSDLPAIVLPEISDMYLDTMDLESDGLGRLNLILKGSETVYRNEI
jgi:hypothetical protein